MENNVVKAFFDKCAHNWDQDNLYNEDIVNQLLDNARIIGNIKVLDVGSGTGVLFEAYQKRQVDYVGIDISSEMVKYAKIKYPKARIYEGDIYTYKFDETFDCIMIYNAFPHFSNPGLLIDVLTPLLNDGGIISICHSMSKEELDYIHMTCAKEVSNPMMEIEDLAVLFKNKYDILDMISNNKMYQIVVKKR